jgi:transcriptional antiterminator RfaH
MNSPVHPSAAWYVCHTKPRQEAVAEAHLVEQGYEVYLPRLAQWAHRRGDWQRSEAVLFPRYCFVRPGHAGQSLAPVRSTPSVSALVRFGGEPAVLADSQLQAIRALAAQMETAVRQNAAPFATGESVTVIDGPLKGLAGIVSAAAADRVMVLLSLLGREQTVALPARQLVAA